VELVNLSDALNGRTPLRQIANPLRAGQWRLVSDIMTAKEICSRQPPVNPKIARSFSNESLHGTEYLLAPLLP
jgi:hypothetical protein